MMREIFRLADDFPMGEHPVIPDETVVCRRLYSRYLIETKEKIEIWEDKLNKEKRLLG